MRFVNQHMVHTKVKLSATELTMYISLWTFLCLYTSDICEKQNSLTCSLIKWLDELIGPRIPNYSLADSQFKNTLRRPLDSPFTAVFMAAGWILFEWVRVPEAWASRGNPGIYFSGKFEKSSCWSPLFLHSESHFNPPSQIKRTFAAHEGVRTHPSHHPAVPPPLCLRPWS